MNVRVMSNFSFDDFQTGDILLFEGDGLPSEIIEWVTDSRYSHCATVVRQKEGPFCWQSYEPLGGVTLRPLVQFLVEYQGENHAMRPIAWVRHLTVARTKLQLQNLNDLIDKLAKRPFPSISQFAENFIRGRVLGEDCGDKTVFCSQLVALAYKAMELLGDEHPPNWYAPESFSTRASIHLNLGASLGDEICIPLQTLALLARRNLLPTPNPSAGNS
jgi:hypothetical protein